MRYFQLPHRQWRLLVQNCHWRGSLVRGFSDPNGAPDLYALRLNASIMNHVPQRVWTHYNRSVQPESVLLAPAEISHCIREAMPSALPHATPPDPILIQVARSPPQEQ